MIKKTIISLVLVSNLIAAVVYADENNDGSLVRIGLSADTFDYVNQNDAIAAIKVWAETVLKERELKEKTEVSFLDTFEALSSAFYKGTVDAGSISTLDALRLGIEPDYIYLPTREDGFKIRYALIVHRKNRDQALKTLADKQVMISQGQQMLLARLWLKSVLTGKWTANSGGENWTSVKKPSKAILQVFFQQAEAAVVTAEAFETAGELNPQLNKDILIVKTSPLLISSFFMLHPTWRGESRDRIESAIINLHATPGGRQVLNVFQSSRMDRHPGSILDSTRQFIMKNRQFIPGEPIR